MKIHSLLTLLIIASTGLNWLFALQRAPEPDPQQQDTFTSFNLNTDKITGPEVIGLFGTDDRTAGLWTGTISTDWHTAGNWSDNTVPTATTDVTIQAGTPYQPAISGTAYCNNLLMQANTSLTQNNGSVLHVYGAFDVGGNIYLEANRIIDVAGSIVFQDGSQANVTGGTIKCGGNFRVEDNTSTNIQLTNATVVLNGTGNQLIQDIDGNSIHHLTINKPSGTASIDEASLSIAGNLDIEAGTFSIGQWTCDIGGNTNISGTLAMTHASGVINANGNVVWNSGSNANFTAMNIFNVLGHWNFESGSNANLANGLVAFHGSVTRFIRNYSSTSSFNNIGSYKTVGADLGITTLSTQPLTINGNVYVAAGALFSIYTSQNVILKGDLISHGNFVCTSGTVVLNGASQNLRMNTGNYFNHLTFNQSGTVTIDDASTNIIEVRGNVLISSGVFDLQDRIMKVRGNWSNNAFPNGFNAGTGRVIFNGVANQICLSENFYTLELNKAGGALVIPSNTICQFYDWQAGGIVANGGTFTTNELVQGSIYGSYTINSAGTINLHQSEYQLIDFYCNIIISSGTMNIFGGVAGSESHWPGGSGSASINMSGGVLDIKDQVIRIVNTGTLTTNISGGKIRTPKGYMGDRSTFQPTAGTFEFYGPDNFFISQSNGSTLYNVTINKDDTGDDSKSKPIVTHGIRSNTMLSDGGRSGTISLGSNFTITNNLIVESGTLNIGIYELTVAREAFFSGTLNMTNAEGVLNAGTQPGDWLEFKSGSNTSITHGTINCYGWILPRPGSSFNLGLGNTLNIKGEFSGGLSNFEPTATFGNVVIAKNPGDYAVIDLFATEPIIVNGSFTISENNTFIIQFNRMTVHGEFTDAASSVIQVLFPSAKSGGVDASSSKEPGEIEHGKSDYYLEIDNDFDLRGQLFINNNGNVFVRGRFSSSPGSSININNGSFIADSPNHPDRGWEYIEGNLTFSDGLFEITNNSVHFGSTATTSVSGGIIRSGGAFYATSAGVFQPSGGTVEITGAYPYASIYCYNGNYFHNLLINRTGHFSMFADSYPVTIQNDFTINHGEIRTETSEISVFGNVSVNSGGKLLLANYASMLLGSNKTLTINNGGILELTGNITNQPKISRTTSGYYEFNVENGGTISADYALFEYMNANGINIKPDAIVNPANSFSNCIFRNGQSGGRLLNINNSQTIGINHVSFTGSSGDFNVSKTVNTGIVTLSGYSGSFAGSTFEQDPFNRIHWGGQTAEDVTLQGVEIVTGQDLCFEATNMLTIGGGGTSFVVHNGGFVELVAGQKIHMLEGTHAYNGSYLHARITTTGDYCGLPSALIAVIDEVEIPEAVMVGSDKELFFKVYPNPSTGLFNLELSEIISTIIVEIYGLMGEQILRQEVSGLQLYEFDLSRQPQGIYIIRVMNGDKMGVERVIRQ